MLQGAGLRRRQVTRISIKGIIDVGTAERKNNTFMYPFGAKAYLEIYSTVKLAVKLWIKYILFVHLHCIYQEEQVLT